MSAAAEEATLLRIESLTKTFPGPSGFSLGGKRPRVRALTGVDLEARRGETLGIVGESGCGKSTLARCIVRLLPFDEGRIAYDGEDVSALRGEAGRRYHRRVQMVFQDPYGSLNPRMSVAATLAEPLRVHRLCDPAEVPARVASLLELVRLPRAAAERKPHEFSGGQRQRIGIARALAMQPECLVADEIVSALDVSVQAQISNLLLELQERLRLTMLFIAHDLRLVRHLSHRVAVMYLGRVVEFADAALLFGAPRHPYTQALLSAAPRLDPRQRSRVEAVRGELPSPLAPPPGCAFHPRCPAAEPVCRATPPPLAPLRDGRRVACHVAARADAASATARPVVS
jgi:oligopeptide transport system ATP-binding protein